MTTTDEPPLILWGRCRTGRRWFWTAQHVGGDTAHGWADTHPEASRQANAAALDLAGGWYANIHVLHGVATVQLRKLNAAKKAARPPKTHAGHRADGTAPVGHLYAVKPGRYDYDDQTWINASVVKLPITKKTPRRIYYLRPAGPISTVLGFVDRQELEACGSVLVGRDGLLMVFAEPPDLGPAKPAAPDLAALKKAMADAHPDRGGTNETFIAARQRYTTARRKAQR